MEREQQGYSRIRETREVEDAPRLGLFFELKKGAESLSKEDERKKIVEEFIQELESSCQEYLKIDSQCKSCWEKVQEASKGDKQDRETALEEMEIWMLAKVNKKNSILDDLNILHRLLGDSCSWHIAFADEKQFKDWVKDRCQELEN